MAVKLFVIAEPLRDVQPYFVCHFWPVVSLNSCTNQLGQPHCKMSRYSKQEYKVPPATTLFASAGGTTTPYIPPPPHTSNHQTSCFFHRCTGWLWQNGRPATSRTFRHFLLSQWRCWQGLFYLLFVLRGIFVLMPKIILVNCVLLCPHRLIILADCVTNTFVFIWSSICHTFIIIRRL